MNIWFMLVCTRLKSHTESQIAWTLLQALLVRGVYSSWTCMFCDAVARYTLSGVHVFLK